MNVERLDMNNIECDKEKGRGGIHDVLLLLIMKARLAEKKSFGYDVVMALPLDIVHVKKNSSIKQHQSKYLLYCGNEDDGRWKSRVKSQVNIKVTLSQLRPALKIDFITAFHMNI